MATCVAAKAMNRNMNVPANSPRNAIISLRTALGMKARRFRRRSFGGGLFWSPFAKGRTGFLKLTILVVRGRSVISVCGAAVAQAVELVLWGEERRGEDEEY